MKSVYNGSCLRAQYCLDQQQEEQRDDAYLDFTQRANSAMTMNSRKNTPQAESSHQPQKCFVKAQQQLKLHSTFPYHQIGISGQKVNDLRKFLIHLLLRFWFKAVELVAWFFFQDAIFSATTI